jgi:hypothetical protein
LWQQVDPRLALPLRVFEIPGTMELSNLPRAVGGCPDFLKPWDLLRRILLIKVGWSSESDGYLSFVRSLRSGRAIGKGGTRFLGRYVEQYIDKNRADVNTKNILSHVHMSARAAFWLGADEAQREAVRCTCNCQNN